MRLFETSPQTGRDEALALLVEVGHGTENLSHDRPGTQLGEVSCEGWMVRVATAVGVGVSVSLV